MTQSNEPGIEMMNIAIARFMGASIDELGNVKFKSPADGIGITGIGKHAMRYHYSFDWLMPVIKKIREMHTNLLLTDNGGVGAYIKAAGKMNRGLMSCDIAKAHEGVHQFITWYNECQQKQTNAESKI